MNKLSYSAAALTLALLFSTNTAYGIFNFRKKSAGKIPADTVKVQPGAAPESKNTAFDNDYEYSYPENYIDLTNQTDAGLTAGSADAAGTEEDLQLLENVRYTAEEEIAAYDTTGVLPEEYDYMLDYLLQSWMARQTVKPECTFDSPPAAVSDAEYKARLAQLPHIIEMPYNSLVRSLIDVYTVKKRQQLEYMLGISDYYFPIFEQALEANKLPLELKYLPVIESALNPKAVSHMGASGLWQFMIATGRLYGLEINSLVDERLDPVKSTDAAIRFLKDLYSIYGDWHLAIAAYNCGPGNVNKAIRRSGGKRDFWKIYPYLPRETRGYVPIFIAANYAMNFAGEHNICPAEVEMPVLADTIMVDTRIHLEQVAAVLNMPIEQIRTLNPQYRRDIIPGDLKPYALVLPLQYANAYIERRSDIYAYKADELVNNRRKEIEIYRSAAPGGSGKLITHKVKSGETLGGIAVKYGTSAAKIRSWNNISGSRIYANQRLKIYK